MGEDGRTPSSRVQGSVGVQLKIALQVDEELTKLDTADTLSVASDERQSRRTLVGALCHVECTGDGRPEALDCLAA